MLPEEHGTQLTRKHLKFNVANVKINNVYLRRMSFLFIVGMKISVSKRLDLKSGRFLFMISPDLCLSLF